MALDPQSKAELDKFTKIAKAIIYEPTRMKQFMTMLGTTEGAVTAVKSVIAVIEKKRPVPNAIQPTLGLNAYLAMVDVAQESTGFKADPGIVKKVGQSIITELTKQVQQQPGMQPAQPQPAQQAPQGLMASMQGAPA